MNYSQLRNTIFEKKNFLCVGLDPDFEKIPKHLKLVEYPQFEFCKEIIDSVAKFCVAFKPNTAFFEEQGSLGWRSLELTIEYINKNYPSHFTIADAKRGDIGNTAKSYAKAFFSNMQFNSVTIAPYMGRDSIIPFLEYKNKWAIILALTSNESANDFETLILNSGEKLFENVLKISKQIGNNTNIMFVVGATKPEDLKVIRNLAPDYFFLVPGVGAQGGSLGDVVEKAWNKDCGLLVNVSRSIIFASSNIDFAEKAKNEAEKISNEMGRYF